MMGASGYAAGNSVAFAASPDLHLAAHEAAHVVQQRAGVHLKGGVGEVGDTYERHADAVADLVVQGKSAESLLDQMAPSGAASSSVQLHAVQRNETEAHRPPTPPSQHDILMARIHAFTDDRMAREQLSMIDAARPIPASGMVEVQLVLGGTATIAQSEVEAIRSEAEAHWADLHVARHGTTTDGLESQLAPAQMAALTSMFGRYSYGSAGTAATIGADLTQLRDLLHGIRGQLDPVTAASLRQVATGMQRGLDATTVDEGPTIGPDRGEELTMDEVAERQHAQGEALRSMTEGPFASLFFSIEVLHSGDYQRAYQMAALGGDLDILCAVGGDPMVRGMEMGEAAHRDEHGHLPTSSVIGAGEPTHMPQPVDAERPPIDVAQRPGASSPTPARPGESRGDRGRRERGTQAGHARRPPRSLH